MRVAELPDDGPEAPALPRAARAARDPLRAGRAGVRAAERRAAGGRPDLTRWLRMARLVRTSLEANGGICRSLLQFRHDLAADPEEVAR